MKQDVEADCLAALMVLDRNLEPTPEPFRMQPDVQLVINFEEYVKFISLLPQGQDLLYFPTDKLQESVDGRVEQSLLKAFYLDMAMAVCKEVFFAEYNGKCATVIRHEFYDCDHNLDVVLDPNTHLLLSHILQEKGFPMPCSISTANLVHWSYACKLLQDASKAPTRWVEKP